MKEKTIMCASQENGPGRWPLDKIPTFFFQEWARAWGPSYWLTNLLKESGNLSRPLIKRRKQVCPHSREREKSGHIILFSFLFISRDMIHVTIFFSFYCWPSAWGWLNGQQKENEDVSTWIIDSWPWKSFLLLGFNLQHITIIRFLFSFEWSCCRLKAFPREREWCTVKESITITSSHFFSFVFFLLLRENNERKQ